MKVFLDRLGRKRVMKARGGSYVVAVLLIAINFQKSSEKKMSFKMKSLIFSGLAVLVAAPAFAGTYFQNSPGSSITSIDFSSVSFAPGHTNWSTWTPPGSGSAGTRFVDLELNAKPAAGGGQCYEVQVTGGPGTANPDIQMYTQGAASIDDDGSNGSRTPLARLWITSSFNLRLSAYSNASNEVDFTINNFFITATTSGQCDNGSYPFYNQATNTVLRANSTAN